MTMKQEKKRIYLRAALALAALLVVLLALDNLSFVPSMLLTVLRKGAIYALVAVSMNLLNGFTGLFSLGQAGFMLLGAYTYAILTIPAASQKSIYQRYANGGIGFSREMIMMLAYEVPLLMIMLTVAMKVGGGSGAEFSLTKIMDYQAEHGSFGLTPVMWPAFLAWLMFLPATLGVPPFDQPEAETEILEGPLLEYSGVLLAFFHMASALKMVVALALGVVLFFPGTISDIPAVNLVWFVVKCALFMLFTLTVVKSATGRLRIEQALSFFLKYPAGLALLSLILVWIGC